MRKSLMSGLFVSLFFSLLVSAQPSDEVIKETQDFLKDRKQVEAFAEKDAGAKRANDAAELAVGTGVEKDQLLKMTSDIMAVLIKKQNGDVTAMQADLMNAMRDPKKFIESLSPEHRAQIRTLASEVEKKNKPAGAQKP